MRLGHQMDVIAGILWLLHNVVAHVHTTLEVSVGQLAMKDVQVVAYQTAL